MLGVVWLLTWNPAGSLDHPLRAAVIRGGIGANGGFLVGTNEAQSIVRADEAKERTRELARTNRELEETKAELQETVAQLERSNERLEQFAYAATHDLQEPFRMVFSYLRLLEDRYDDDLDEEAHEYIDFAVDGTDRMRAMVDGLLQYSRVQSEGDPVGPVDLEDVLADARDDLAVTIEATDAKIEADPLPTVEGDENQLRRVFPEPPGESDQVQRRRASADRRQRERTDDGDWRVAVGDDGIGVDPDRIFQMFKQLQSGEDGAGIGLSLCKRVVERHGGEMWLDSEPGEGSTFHVTLPAAEGSAEQRATATAESGAVR